MIIILLGPPGSGKSTQGKFLSKILGVPSISMGQVLRNAKSAQTVIGIEAAKYVEEGKLIPTKMIKMLTEFRLEEDDCKDGFILDGSPREVEQAVLLDDYLNSKGQKVDKVILIDVPEEEILKRLLSRAKLSKEQGGGRADDNIEDIRVRLTEYRETVGSVETYYKNRGVFEIIDGRGSKEEVFMKIREILQL